MSAGAARAAPRICILTFAHLSMNPRLVKEADALAGAGYKVRVIAADYSLWARDADREFASRAWDVACTVPFGPHAPARRRVSQIVTQRLGRLAVALGSRHPRAVEAAWHPVTPDLIRAAAREPADLYIAHYPAALPAAAMAARKHGALYAFDAEDFHLGDAPDSPEFETHRTVVSAIEGRYLPGCAYVTAGAAHAADAYAEHYGIPRPTVVLNVFPRSHAPDGPTRAGSATPGPSLYWFSQTIGPTRGLECALRAIARSRSRPHLYLRGNTAAGFVARLEAIAEEEGVSDRLHILELAPPSELERLASAYDIGLCGEPGHTRNRRISLTNKMFSYLLAGMPIVASDIPSHVRMAPALGKAVRVYRAEDPDDLACALDAFLEDPETLAQARRESFQLGQTRYNWEVERKALLGCVANVLPTCDSLDVVG